MVGDMRETTSTTRNMDTGRTPGQTAGNTKEIGCMGNKMVKEPTLPQMVQKEKEYGEKENE